MKEEQDQDFCNIALTELYEAAYDCEVKVVGAVKEIFKHSKYIVELIVKKDVTIRCLKRYNEFEALYQVLQMNFKNIDLGIGQFPSKFQVFDKEETRRKYFEQMLNRVIHTYLEKITNQTNRRLLSTLYVFLSNGVHRKDKLRLSKEHARKKSDSIETLSGGSIEEYEYAYHEEQSKATKGSLLKNPERSMHSQDTSKIQEEVKRKTFDDIDVSTEEGKLRAFMNLEFLIQFQGENQWKQRYFKLQGSSLLIYRHKNDNNFKTKIEIFQAQINFFCRQKNFIDHFCQKMQIDNLALFPVDKSVLTIQHNYDYKRFLVMMKPNQKLDLNAVRKILIKASHIKPVTEIEGVFDPVAKLFIILHKIHFTNAVPKTIPIVYLRIKMAGYLYQTKRMTYSPDSPLSVRQSFMIPVSDTFENIYIEVIAIENDGFLRKQTQEKVVGFYKMSFADFVSYPSGMGLEKLQVKIEQNNPNPAYQGYMEISAINYSHFSSVYGDSYANVNDGIITNGLKNTSDTEDLILTIDRVLRVVGNLALFITACWRNVYLFKYPRMSYLFFAWLIILFNFGTSFLYIRLFVCNLLIAMIYQHPKAKSVIDNALQIYFFNHIHEAFISPRCLSSDELKFRKWACNLDNIKRDYRLTDRGRLQKKSEAKDRKYEEWTFTVHGKTFNVRQDSPSLLEKVFEAKKIIELVSRMVSAVINSIEKILNVICWADPRRSIWVFGILIFLVTVAEAYIFQIIGTIFCIHRFVKGPLFYDRKHYSSNRKLAVYCLRYIINTHFTNLIPHNEKRIHTINQDDIEIVFHEIYFPLKEEEKLKKFKDDIEHILGVFIDNEDLERNARKNNTLALIHFVSIIESCEARLKLEWISGEQGISQDFQDLKRLTTEEVVIDMWVESLLINFILNIPSQLYTTFRPIRSDVSLKYQKVDDKPAEFKKISI